MTPLRVGTLANIRETFDPLTSVAPTPTATTGDSTADPEKAAQTGGQHVVENDREMDENERRLRMLGYRDVGEVVEAFIKANTKRKRRKVYVKPCIDLDRVLVSLELVRVVVPMLQQRKPLGC